MGRLTKGEFITDCNNRRASCILSHSLGARASGNEEDIDITLEATFTELATSNVGIKS